MSRISDLVRAVDDLPSELVPIPEWGCEIEVRGMDGHGRSEWLARILEAQENEDIEARQRDVARLECEAMVVACFDPEDGSRAFTEDDIPMLMAKAGKVIARLSRKASQLSGLDEGAEERLGKDSSESVKTEPPAPVTQNGASTSTSPVTSG